MIGNDLLVDELDSDEELDQKSNIKLVDQYSQEDQDTDAERQELMQKGLIIDVGNGMTLDLEFPPE
mgnify:CR=1 FL=1